MIIFIRILFVACMVFIIGSIFGSFSQRPALKVISKVAAIVVIVLFIGMNIHGGPRGGYASNGQYECPFQEQDSIRNQ